MQNNKMRVGITLLAGILLIVSAGAIFYVLTQDKNSMDLGLLIGLHSLSLFITAGNLFVLALRKRADRKAAAK
ncbi:hypothetical protein [Saccharibacillus deserti]|uniref:hypothetical protein n=1 Tax=Saccharibacillus deserti TaxID=1634444 RepID=UPI001551A811|nr:hypothetical protein [Saccharibacillus deserti]